jgi:hypothetical protein
MGLVVSWLVFPLVMLGVCLGCGLLVERVGGRRLPGVLLPGVGLGLVIVVAALATYYRATASWATPIVVGLAIVGYLVSWTRLGALRPDPWACALGVGVFAVFAAPVVLSGEATFLGYFVLNDTAVHFSLIDQLMSRGRDVAGLPTSSFRYAVNGYLSSGYPRGAHVGLGALRPLVGQDVAWVFQPYLAMIMTLNGLALYQVMSPAVRSPRLRVASAFVAALSGLTYAYYTEASIKEVATVWALTTVVALVFASLKLAPSVRRVVPLAVVVAAGLAILNLAIAPWLAPPVAAFAAGLVWQRRRAGWPEYVAPLALFGAIVVVLALPVLGQAGTFVAVAGAVLTQQADLGNLVRPLQWWQALGIWPQGDFRFQLTAHQQTAFALMGIALAAGGLGVAWVLRRRALAPMLLIATSVVALLYLSRNGSPYANGKTLMIASPAIVLAAVLGASALYDVRRRLEAWLLLAVIGAGVLWTNALAYHDASPAPRDRLGELASIPQRIHGGGPAFYNQFDEFATHFLRGLAPFTPAFGKPSLRPQLGPRPAPQEKFPYDVNDLALGYVEHFRVLVIGRSPFASRPPVNYRRVYEGRYYEAWQRDNTPAPLEHIPIPGGRSYVFSRLQAGGVPPCQSLTDAAARAKGRAARLAYVERPAFAVLVPTHAARPPDWGLVDGDPNSIIPRGVAGTVVGNVHIPTAGRYAVWAEGTFDRALDVVIDGKRVGRLGPRELGPPGQFVPAGRTELPTGSAQVKIVRGTDNLSPGDGGNGRLLGPLVLQPSGDQPRVQYIDPANVRQLCGRRLDWVEIVR